MSKTVAALSQKPTTVKGRWRGLFALSIGTITDGQEWFVLNSLFPTIRDALGLNYTALSIFTTINELATIVIQPLWAIIGTRYNRKSILVLFTGFWGIWSLLAGFANSFTMLLFFFAMAMIGAAASGGIAPAVLSDLFADEERSKAFGVAAGIALISGVIITPSFALLTRFDDGWRYGFFIMGGISILSGLLIWFLLDDPGKGGSERELVDINEQIRDQIGFRAGDLPNLFKIGSFVRYIVPQSFDSTRLVLSFLVVYMVDVLGVTNASAVVLLVPVLLGGMIGAFGGAWFIKQIHIRNPQLGRLWVYTAILIVALIASVLGTQFTYNSIAPYTAAFAIWGLAKGVERAVAPPVLHAFLLPETRGPASSIARSLRSIVTLLFGVSAGVLSDRFGLGPVFSILFVGSAFVQLLAFLFIFSTYTRDVGHLHVQLARRSQDFEQATQSQ